MKTIRQLHLYTGVFFAPTIIFFAFTGFLQTYSWHEGAKAPRWIVALENVHTHQRMPPPPPQPAPPVPSAERADLSFRATQQTLTTPAASAPPAAQASAAPAQPTPPRRKRSAPLRAFMGLMAVGLIGSSLAGIYMGFRLGRSAGLIWGLLLSGVIIPVAAFYIGVQP